ncbi:MAG: hypothetical protein WCO56_29695 [Verrucomicrobiota bacterium]
MSTYTLRLNHRRKLFGHVFSGRYKALIVDGNSRGYLKTVYDYAHLNPVRARLLTVEDRLLSYPWSRFAWYLASPAHRPAWVRVDRLMGEHGIPTDTAAGRQEFERRMETMRARESDGTEWEPLRRGWCLGPETFRQELLDRMAGQLGEHHAGELRRESAEAKAERIIDEELKRLGWTRVDLEHRTKSDPEKVAVAARLRRETTLTIKAIAARLHLGSWKSTTTRLQQRKRKEKSDETRPLL